MDSLKLRSPQPVKTSEESGKTKPERCRPARGVLGAWERAVLRDGDCGNQRPEGGSTRTLGQQPRPTS